MRCAPGSDCRWLPRLLIVAAAAVALGGSVSLHAEAAGVPRWNAWLCFPGSATDWCQVELGTTVFGPSGKPKSVPVSVPRDPKIDCFYVYPTVSTESRPNSDLKVMPEERETAITQAARFSHVCRVYAPMYHQVTTYAGRTVFGVTIPQGNYELEYADVRAAWHDYMAHYNDGRGVVLIGHSEGSYLLKRLLASEYPSIRKVFVSAILLGGNVTVNAQDRYAGIPACTSPDELRCIVAYSSWDRTPPAAANFQEPGAAGEHVLCVNPAALGGGKAPITPIFGGINSEGIVPDTSFYVAYHWVEFPDLYTARCVRDGSRAWLLVSRIQHPGDRRPTVVEALGPDRGLHAADVNITLANLVALVGSQRAEWLRLH